MTVLAGWALVLGRLSGQPEVVIGTPTANRRRRRAGRPDRLLRQHPGAADRPGRRADRRRAAGPGAGTARWPPWSTRTCRSSRSSSWSTRPAAWRTPRCSRCCSPGRTTRTPSWSCPASRCAPLPPVRRGGQVRPDAVPRPDRWTGRRPDRRDARVRQRAVPARVGRPDRRLPARRPRPNWPPARTGRPTALALVDAAERRAAGGTGLEPAPQRRSSTASHELFRRQVAGSRTRSRWSAAPTG